MTKNRKRVISFFVLVALVIIILMLLNRCGEAKKDEGKKELEIEVDYCPVMNWHITELEELLSAADFCSKEWFIRYYEYLDNLGTARVELAKTSKEENKETIILQDSLIKSLSDFSEKRSIDNLESLEMSFKEYFKLYETKCEGVER